MVCFKAFAFIFSIACCQFSKYYQITDGARLSEQELSLPVLPATTPQGYSLPSDPQQCSLPLPPMAPQSFAFLFRQRHFSLRRKQSCAHWHQHAYLLLGFLGPQMEGGPGGAVLPPSYRHTEIHHYLDCTRSRKLSWEMKDVLIETTSALLSDTIPTLKNCQRKHRDLLVSSTQ